MEMAQKSTGDLIISQIEEDIKKGDVARVISNISRLPLGKITKEKSDKLFGYFLILVSNVQNPEIAREIIIEFDKKRTTDSCLIDMFFNPLLTEDVLSFIVLSFLEKKPIDYFCDLIVSDERINRSEILKKLPLITKICTPMSYDNWKKLNDLMKEMDSDHPSDVKIQKYFQEQMDKNGNYAPIPKWIRYNLPSPELKSIPENIPTVKEARDLILKGMMEDDIDIIRSKNDKLKVDSIRMTQEMVALQYATAPIHEKLLMIEPFFKDKRKIEPFDATLYFQEFGPINTRFTESSAIDPDDPCEKYGGCHMLLCNEFEDPDEFTEDLEEDYESPEWFTGICKHCEMTIAKPEYAVREPLLHGGWRGCYCSFEHMEHGIDNPLVLTMIARIKEQLNIMGIRDK